MALVTCPTGSIGTKEKRDLGSALAAYPEQVDENVYFCGFASRNSYGAASYFILRPEGNVLIDCPRFATQLVRRIEEAGGVSAMFLTHRDDVADHEKFRKHFGCTRVIHRLDAGGTHAEQLLDGKTPTVLDQDLVAIPTPGHTRGHAVLLYREKYLFTGDHLAYENDRLEAFRDVCWYSWREQTQSMKRLLDYRFEWVLPGHGRRGHRPSGIMHQKLMECIEWMESIT
jgi:glyoxylase-like metal-dependent hydrolase (beta-lactamase superfamily II)